MRLGVLLAIALLSSACDINRNTRISNTYLVPHLAGMTRDRKVQWARVKPGFRMTDYASIYVPQVRLEGNAKGDSLGPELAASLRERIFRELSKKYPVTEDPGQIPREGRKATLDLAITEIRSGNGFIRWFIGTGLAPTVLQVEGRLHESGLSEPVVEFVRRRSFDGYSYGGLNFGLFSARSTHRSSIKDIARDTAAFFGRAGWK